LAAISFFATSIGSLHAAAAAAPADWPRPADGKPMITEDFESGTLDKSKWMVYTTGNATVTVAQDKVAHGKNALKVHYPAGGSAWAFAAMTVPESLRDHFYGRAYMYISSAPSGHCVFITGGTTGYPYSNFLEIGDRQNQFQPSFQQNDPKMPRFEDHPLQGTPPIGRWFCLEWEYNDKPDRIVMWVDGKLMVNQTFAMNGVKTGLVGGFSELAFSFHVWGNAAKDMDIYYDDIAIGDKPIGQLTPVGDSAAPAAPAATDAAKPAAPTQSASGA
jgi:hypothetical protein